MIVAVCVGAVLLGLGWQLTVSERRARLLARASRSRDDAEEIEADPQFRALAESYEKEEQGRRRSYRSPHADRSRELTVRLEPIESGDIPADVHPPRPKAFYFRSVTLVGEPVYFGVTPEDEWIDVFARARRSRDAGGHYTGRYKEYGFSFIGGRWSFGAAPAGATEIRDMIEAIAIHLGIRHQ